MKTPPFCPYSGCDAHFHPSSSTRWFVRRGSYRSARAGRTQRYRCLSCGRSFSDATFSIDFYVHRVVDYRQLLLLTASCTGVRQMGRTMGIHRGMVLNRIMRLARQAISLQTTFMRDHLLDEPVVADGLRSFWISQFVPNEFATVVGKKSRFCFAYTAYSLRRSGRMTDAQREKRDQLERLFRASAKAAEEGFSRIIDEVTRICPTEGDELVVHTDENQAYTRALKKNGGWGELAQEDRVKHVRTSSKRPRTANNPLAAINSFDRSVRNDLAEHVRETIRFARSVGASQDRFAVYEHWHNFRKRASIDETRHEERTHAELVGYPVKELKRALRGFFTKRVFYTRNPPWGVLRDVWLRTQWTPFHDKPDYLPSHLVV